MSTPRRNFLQNTAASTVLFGNSAGSVEPTKDEPADNNTLAQCKARIEQDRRSDCAIALRNQQAMEEIHWQPRKPNRFEIENS